MSDPVSVHQAVSKVMAELPAIGKDGKAAPTQGGYAYRGIEQITRHVQSLFAKHGVVIVPEVRSIETRDLLVNNKPWTDTTLVVDYTITGPDGSQLSATTVGIGRDNSDKGANKAMTQAFKYLLLQVLCISDEKDDVDGKTWEADEVTAPVEPPHAGRAKAAFAALTHLTADQQAAMRNLSESQGGTALSVKAMVADTAWLDTVETQLAAFEAGA